MWVFVHRFVKFVMDGNLDVFVLRCNRHADQFMRGTGHFCLGLIGESRCTPAMSLMLGPKSLWPNFNMVWVLL